MIDADERQELIRLAASSSLKEDMRYLSEHRHNPVIKNGEVDIDAYIDFVQQFNEFINHEPKPFKPIIDRDMRL